MKLCTFTFQDWESGYVPEEAPPESVLENLAPPLKYRNYRPAWGKGSPSAEKAVHTRNKGIRERNVELFRREVLPGIVDLLCPESLKDAGLLLRDAGLLSRSGFRFYQAPDGRGAWLADGDSRITQALAMDAQPISAEQFLAGLP